MYSSEYILVQRTSMYEYKYSFIKAGRECRPRCRPRRRQRSLSYKIIQEMHYGVHSWLRRWPRRRPRWPVWRVIAAITPTHHCWRSGSEFQYSITSFNDIPRSKCRSNYERYYALSAPRWPRVRRNVDRDAVESVPTFSVTATHIKCYIYIIIV